MGQTCYVEPVQKEVSAADQNAAQMVILAVWGLGCENCANRVRNSLLHLDGVVSADIGIAHGLVLVDYVPSKTSVDEILHAVTAAGHDGRHHYRAEIIPEGEESSNVILSEKPS